ncbi:putative nucleotidyltransferase [Rhizobium petrolearium]|uniref:nucleotidyltransferase domain-containing protein n=1 Tax=Neorhizobium petrolearium TaxID=515361 RepID=UPI001AE3FFBD|nr:nucleotidyltransferase domain-containing protein [Neorhizobium petrolearium]MBP1844676.1 putative nucleotidyltransferase [Neorhizobium petrolearium]
MDKATVINDIAAALRNEPTIAALFLSGSYGAGIEDAYSDIDFLAVSRDGPTDEFAALLRESIGKKGEIVLWRDRQIKPTLINAITADWLRIDVDIINPDQMARRSADGLKVVFDHDRILETLPTAPSRASPDPARMKWQFEEFIRIFGLLPLAIGRGEYLNGITGIFHLRNLLTELLIEETAAPNRGGALHLNRLITEEQKQVLAGLPLPSPTREAIISANLAYAKAYLPRARRVATKIGVEWPERFEAATWAHLRHMLGIEFSDT